MAKWIRRIIMLVLLVIFLVSGGMVLSILHQYRVSEIKYQEAADRFVSAEATPAPAPEKTPVAPGVSTVPEPDAERRNDGPGISVDFEALWKVAPDAVAWLYCEGTDINYPVMYSGDNDYYLHRSYDKTYSFPGSIFIDAMDGSGFTDYNTIIYGHNMKDGTMFAHLSRWSDQSYYDEHPVMWLITPEQTYRVLLFSGYTTSTGAECYAIIKQPGPDLDRYLSFALSQSDFHSDVNPDPEAHYVLLSTCSYVFTNARFVLHGMLVPLDEEEMQPDS